MDKRIKIVDHFSDEYWDTIELRDKLLREPLNLIFTIEELSKEVRDVHFAYYFRKQVVGAVVISPRTGTKRIRMRQLAVEPDHQGKGIGAKLVQAAEEWAVENGYPIMYCNARKEAAPFYEKQDYWLVGDEFPELGIPHYRMEKYIDD